MHRDVIVIGAGMAGLLTAYRLKKQGKNVLVLEAKTISSGQTGRTTAKITCQHDIKYSKLLKTLGYEKAKQYAKANKEAIREYEKIIMENGIECDFKRTSAYLYTKTNTQILKEEVKAASLLGIDAYYTKKTELPFSVEGAVCFRDQAQFEPHRFIKFISAGLDIYENTKVLKIKGNKVITSDGVFNGDSIVVATHYPIVNVPGFYFLRQHQERSYVLELSGCPRIEGMYYGVDNDGFSFRQAGENLLFGGASHRTGVNPPKGSFCYLRKKAKELYPESKEVSCWAAQDCMPHDGVPFIGKYSYFKNNLYVITGFQKWGMTSSMVAAMIITDMICGKKNPYSKVFSPQRIYVKAGIVKFLTDVVISTKGLVCGFFGGRKKRCTHLGCRLVWNKEEKSFDCPCHGSRFDDAGHVLDNPAIKLKRR